MPSTTKNGSSAMLDAWGRSNNRKLPDRRCSDCGTRFKPRKADSHYCSRPCAWKNNGRPASGKPSWWVNQNGYIEGRVWVDGVPKRLKQHRWVYEQHSGEPIPRGFCVHHINGIKTDNRIENLELMEHGAHAAEHSIGRKHTMKTKKLISDARRRAIARATSHE